MQEQVRKKENFCKNSYRYIRRNNSPLRWKRWVSMWELSSGRNSELLFFLSFQYVREEIISKPYTEIRKVIKDNS